MPSPSCNIRNATGMAIDPSICQALVTPPGPVACGPKMETFTGQNVAKKAWVWIGLFPVLHGTLVQVLMHGEVNPGDPNLYVRLNQDPETDAFDCRPYLSRAEETCSMDVPTTATTAHVRV